MDENKKICEGENDSKTKSASACFVILFLGLLALGFAEIGIALLYIHDCNMQELVPYYLIVSAFAPILLVYLNKSNDDESHKCLMGLCRLAAFVFNITWLIYGSKWIYPTYWTLHDDTYIPCPVNGTPGPANCTEGTCNEILITSSFAMITLHWVCMGIYLLVILCLACILTGEMIR